MGKPEVIGVDNGPQYSLLRQMQKTEDSTDNKQPWISKIQ